MPFCLTNDSYREWFLDKKFHIYHLNFPLLLLLNFLRCDKEQNWNMQARNVQEKWSEMSKYIYIKFYQSSGNILLTKIIIKEFCVSVLVFSCMNIKWNDNDKDLNKSQFLSMKMVNVSKFSLGTRYRLSESFSIVWHVFLKFFKSIKVLKK